MLEPISTPKNYLSMESYENSLARILTEAAPTTIEYCSIDTAVGRVLAEDLIAPLSVPSFDNSAMDGFAFSSRSTEGSSSARPVSMPVVGASIAGDTAGVSHLQPGFAAKIMTGAPMPEGADTVLPVEYASWQHESLTFYDPYPAGKHVRRVGEDTESGTSILIKGTCLQAQNVPLLCALGFAKVPVWQKPSAAWISTGQEITDDFEQPLQPGHIYNATGLYGRTIANRLGLDLKSTITVRDTPQDFSAALNTAIDAGNKIILSTGGVSAGEFDFVRPALEDAGAEIIVHKARIKPGKPVLFAKLPNDAFFFGLPGNPLSTALALRAFVYPFVRALTGQVVENPNTATLTKSCKATADKTVFLLGAVKVDKKGSLLVTASDRQQSFHTASFAESNCWLISPEGRDVLSQGSAVKWLPITPGGCDIGYLPPNGVA